MGLEEIKTAVAQLSPDELAAFYQWFETFFDDYWQRHIEADIQAIWLDDADSEAGRCTPLTEAQRRELERRIAAHEANPSAAIPWEQVQAEALARRRR
jgi:putative addiction module component (TIGR02574 family)